MSKGERYRGTAERENNNCGRNEMKEGEGETRMGLRKIDQERVMSEDKWGIWEDKWEVISGR